MKARNTPGGGLRSATPPYRKSSRPELLPGIEEFLTHTLAEESLSNFAEERRQYFLERLDIVNLPPSVPPRAGRVLPLELLKETELSSGVLVDLDDPDFAATQREISRSFIDHGSEATVNATDKAVKIYDDIDLPDSGDCSRASRHRLTSDSSHSQSADNNLADTDDDDDNDLNGGGGTVLYEIPISKPLPTDDNSVSCGADDYRLATIGSAEEKVDGRGDASTVTSREIPPPVPPRKERSLSETGSRDSASDNKPPDLPFRPPLHKRSEIYARSDKSDRSETEKSFTSDPDLSGGDSTSYESFDEDNDQADIDVTNKFDVKLPKKLKKKTKLTRSRKLIRSKSPLQGEINVPFKNLQNIDISGELFDRGKLKWHRRLVAISNGHMIVYKPEKDARPSLVIPLAGYEAGVCEREGRRGYEVKMAHDDDESHTFCLDLKEWAHLWAEHINGHAKGQPPPKYHTHLASSFIECVDSGHITATFGSKNDLTGPDTNAPTEAGAEEVGKARGKRKKVTRMGSFAFRATQFLENIGKKTSGRKRTPHPSDSCRHSSGGSADTPISQHFHLPISSSCSVGNLAKELVSPTSDSSSSSMFGGARASSQPTTPLDASGSMRSPWERDEGSGSPEVACQGHLNIFSSYNKRSWGQRWCLVRGNIFECYRDHHCKVCELSFGLNSCVLRGAVTETRSEFGLMLLEAGREKITIEPLSKQEMNHWVRVLLRETNSYAVPEGIGVFLQDSDDMTGPEDGNSQVVSHEYEDPMETLAVAAELGTHYQVSHDARIPGHTDKDPGICPGSDPEATQNLDSKPLSNTCILTTDSKPLSNTCILTTDSKPLSNKYNQTTDSKPLSNKYNETTDSKPLSNKYNQTTDSGFYSVRETNSDSDSSCENNSLERRVGGAHSPVYSQKGDNSLAAESLHKKTTEAPKNSTKGCSFPRVPGLVSDKECTLATSSVSSSSAAKSKSARLSCSTVSSHQSNQTNASTNIISDINTADLMNSSKINELENYNINSASSIQTPSSSRRPSQIVFSPSGEEYSVILKRSERESLGHNSSFESSDSKVTKYLKSTSRENHETENCIASNNNNNIKNPIDSTISLTAESFKQPMVLGAVSPMISTKARFFTETSKSPPSDDGERTSLLTTDMTPKQPPPLPKSAVPSTHTDMIRFPKSIRSSNQKDDSSSLTANCSETSHEQRVLPTPSKTEKRDSIYNDQDNWTLLITNPDTTTAELRTAIDSFRSKQIETKRKRMAVHDKRQRVLSDEERLACEKEFAALEKLGENTDRAIRTLQNHLEMIDSHTLGIVKTFLARQKSISQDNRQMGK